MKKVENITELIGETPLIKLNRINNGEMADVYVKLESFNPGGSIKDRIALNMIERAEESGELQPGGTIVEPTSGNTGIGLSLVGRSKGYNVVLTMPASMSMERKKLLSAYGAELLLTPGIDGMPGAIEKAEELVAENTGYFMPQQFNNSTNPEVHKEVTAREILDAMEGEVDAFVSGVGTGGTLTGIAQALKEELDEVKIYAVEPEGSPVISGGKPGAHGIQGIGAGFIPEVLEIDILDDVIKIDEEEAKKVARSLAKEEGILAGISSGAAVAAALEVASKLDSDQKLVVIAPDTGERYLSTDLFEVE
jgi:cysteine synthase A